MFFRANGIDSRRKGKKKRTIGGGGIFKIPVLLKRRHLLDGMVGRVMISVVEGLVAVLMNRVPTADDPAVVASGVVGNRCCPLLLAVPGLGVFLGTTTVKR